jgi:hypothetical protein
MSAYEQDIQNDVEGNGVAYFTVISVFIWMN